MKQLEPEVQHFPLEIAGGKVLPGKGFWAHCDPDSKIRPGPEFRAWCLFDSHAN